MIKIYDATAITIFLRLQAEKSLGWLRIELQKLTFRRNAICLFIFVISVQQLFPQSKPDLIDKSNNSSEPTDLHINSPFGEFKLYAGKFGGITYSSNSANLVLDNLIYKSVLTEGLDDKNNHYASPLGFKYLLYIKYIDKNILFGLDKINFNSTQKSLGIKQSIDDTFPTVSSFDSNLDLTDWNFGILFKISNDFTLIPKYTVRQFSQKYIDNNFIGDPNYKDVYFKSLNERARVGILGLIGVYQISNHFKFNFDFSLPFTSLDINQNKATKYYSYSYLDIFDQNVYQTFTSTTAGNYQQAGLGSYDLGIDPSKSNRTKLGIEYEVNEKVSLELSYHQEYISFQRKNVQVIVFDSLNVSYNNGDLTSFTSSSKIDITKSLINQTLNQNLTQNFFYQGLSFQIVVRVF